MSAMIKMFMTDSRSCLRVAVHVLHDEGMHDIKMVDEADDHVVAAHVGDAEDVTYSRSCLLVAIHVLYDEGMHDVSTVDEAHDHGVAAHVGDDEDVHDGLKFATQLARTPENPKPEAQNPEKHQASHQHASLFL